MELSDSFERAEEPTAKDPMRYESFKKSATKSPLARRMSKFRLHQWPPEARSARYERSSARQT